jgi:hypothetical protein
MTSNKTRFSAANDPQGAAFSVTPRSPTATGSPYPPPEHAPWMTFFARHLFDDIDPATRARDEASPEDEPE